jgi:hypothetical protein
MCMRTRAATSSLTAQTRCWLPVEGGQSFQKRGGSREVARVGTRGITWVGHSHSWKTYAHTSLNTITQTHISTKHKTHNRSITLTMPVVCPTLTHVVCTQPHTHWHGSESNTLRISQIMDDIAFCQLLTYHNVIITSHQVYSLKLG